MKSTALPCQNHANGDLEYSANSISNCCGDVQHVVLCVCGCADWLLLAYSQQ